MFKPTSAFSGFSVNDIDKAKQFYSQTLGLKLEDTGMGLKISLPGGAFVFAYPKNDHLPASFTILNFIVKDIDTAINALTALGIVFERYEGLRQDDKAISRGRSAKMGPDIAWFKDPAGNILAVLQN